MAAIANLTLYNKHFNNEDQIDEKIDLLERTVESLKIQLYMMIAKNSANEDKSIDELYYEAKEKIDELLEEYDELCYFRLFKQADNLTFEEE